MTRLQISLRGLAVLAAAVVTPAAATLIVPMDIEDLAASSEIVVAGTVEQIVHAELADGRLVTRVAIAVSDAWKGDAPPILELVERGGSVGEVGEMVYGSPSYQLGEPVVVFAARSPLGWQTNHMLQGKFRIQSGADGSLAATRDVGDGVAVLSGRGGAWRPAIPLDELRAAAANSPPPAAVRSALLFEDLDIAREVESAFTTQTGNPRYFEADVGRPLVYLIDSRGDSILGFDASHRAVAAAFAAWNAIAGTSLELVDGGTTDDIDAAPIDGVNRVLFDDPGNEIFDPTNCSGTLGLGGSRFTSAERKTFGGRTFSTILSANIKFADNWDGCEEWDECNFSEVAAHEGGHAFGLGHSSMNPNEGDADLRDALMYYMAHFDGRCADPRTDDAAGIRAVYPAAIPITIVSDRQLPDAVASQPYSFQLSVAGGRGPIAWSRTGVCDESDGGLELSANGEVQGPLDNVVGNGCIEAIATDADGDSHQKRFDVNFVLAQSSPSPTTQATATRTPTPSPTVPANRPCVGDCNDDGRIVISELIRGVNIALRNTEVTNCPSFDRDGNGAVSIAELIASVTAALFGCQG
jgi:hypothetical protein